jgi:hypothetical protein
MFSGDDAELGEVEVGVHRLQRIVGPLDQVEAHRHRSIALHQLQRPAQTGAAIAVDDPRHVRPLRRLAVLDAGQRVDEADHALAVECADQDAAAVHRHGEDRHRHDIVIAGTPDLPLELDDLGELFESGEITVGE